MLNPDAMRLTACFLLAALSGPGVVPAATRPRYGGTLRVESRALAVDGGPGAALVFEPLVRLDDTATIKPWLAASWQPDSTRKRCQFVLRPGVKLHNGSVLTPSAAVAALHAVLPDAAIAATADGLIIRGEAGISSLLLDLAHTPFAATGPFRLAAVEPGKRATLAANADYWGGRPFVDAVELKLGRGLREQLVDLELGKTDVAEIAPADVRRGSAQGRAVWSSATVNLLALEFAPGRAPDVRLRQALALAIDRTAMHNVLLQKHGEPTGALLPEWLSGYAFAFSSAPDLVRARALAAALPAAQRALTLAYDASLPVARSLAERVAVNARDAGLSVQATPQNARADVRLEEVRIGSFDPAHALAGVAAAFGLEAPAASAAPAALYEAERRLLEGYRVIPLFHLPDLYAASPGVRVFVPPAIDRAGDWRFENIWLDSNSNVSP